MLVAIPETDGPAGEPLRFLDFICSDDRFECAGILLGGKDTASEPLRYRTYLRWEQALLGHGAVVDAPHFTAVDRSIPRIDLTCVGTGAGARQSLACDVIVDFTESPLVLSLAGLASHGVWRLSAFTPDGGIGPAVSSAPSSPVDLMQHVGNDTPAVRLARTVFNTKFIAARNRAYLREKSLLLLQHELARLHLLGARAPATRHGANPETLKQGTAPTGQQTGLPTGQQNGLPAYLRRMIGQLAGRAASTLRERTGQRPGQWCLMTGTGNWRDFDPAAADLIRPAGNTYWADPFLFRHDDKTYVFFEEYDYATRQAHISVGQLDQAAGGVQFTYLGPALKLPFHLSYPLVFRHQGEILMMPECNQAERLEIWRATHFPHEWTLHATALDGKRPVDSVLFEYRDDCWLFTNVATDSFGDGSSELHLFKVSGPDLTRVEPHPLNPVVVSSATARGAGRIFVDKGQIIRTSQDNTHGLYGFGVNFMQVTQLDSRNYAETPVRSFNATFKPGFIGCHHFDALDDTYIFDARLAKGHWADA